MSDCSHDRDPARPGAGPAAQGLRPLLTPEEHRRAILRGQAVAAGVAGALQTLRRAGEDITSVPSATVSTAGGDAGRPHPIPDPISKSTPSRGIGQV